MTSDIDAQGGWGRRVLNWKSDWQKRKETHFWFDLRRKTSFVVGVGYEIVMDGSGRTVPPTDEGVGA